MRSALWVLLLFALAVAVTLAARFDQGYVLVVVPPWRLEMSFVLAAVAMLLLFGAIYLLARLVNLALRLPADVRAWRERRRVDKAEDELSRAIAAYLSGQTGHALSLADQARKRRPGPLVALVAAHAALAEGKSEVARVYLHDLKTDVGELTAARQSAEAALAALPGGAPDAPK
ncbi:MAG: heme biosynthesis HemY N-terminal domain-containing protein [Pseudomonadota bacterium]